MTYNKLVPDLLKEFINVSKLQESYRELVSWTEPSPHIVFGDVLLENFLLDELLTMENKELIRKVFCFFEKMANSEDEDIRGVLTATVLERLGDDKDILKKARSFMGSKTLELSHQVEKALGRE